MKRFQLVILATLFVFQLEGSALGASIFTQTAQGNYSNNVLFGTQWDDFTAMMVAEHTIIQGAAFDDLRNLLLYDAVWVDQELGSALTAGEQAARSPPTSRPATRWCSSVRTTAGYHGSPRS